MYKYTIKRILLMIPTAGAAVLIFGLMRLIPGDICELRMAGEGAWVDPQAIEDCRNNLSLNDPFIVNSGILFGATSSLISVRRCGRVSRLPKKSPCGSSCRWKSPLSRRSVVIAIPLGTISAVKQNTWIDHLYAFSIAVAMPSFWLGIIIILGLLISTQHFFGEPWMPPIEYTPIWVDPGQNLLQLIWPAIATGYRYSAVATRMTRSALLEVLREDYIRTARAKGLIEKLIINRHALKNSMLPVVTIVGIEFAFLMGGLVVTEQVFNLNGLGKLFVESVLNHDFSSPRHW